MSRKNKRVTIFDVAEMANVSTMTVSRVINNKTSIRPETKARVLEAIDALGYQPSHIAQSLTNDRTYTIGITVSDIANPFFAELIAGVEAVSWQNGYNVILCNTQEDLQREREVLRLLEAKQVDGVLVCSARLPDSEFFSLLKTFRTAVVFNRMVPSDIAGVVMMDDVEGAKTAVQHLLASGRRKIGIIAGAEISPSAQARIEGFMSAIPDDDPPIERAVPSHIQPGRDAAIQLLTRHQDVDGLLCHNDLVAVGAVEACKELGKRIPEDIAIIGFDDITIAGLISPKLTTLRVDRRETGKLMTEYLLRLIAGEVNDTPLTLTETLIVRESAP